MGNIYRQVAKKLQGRQEDKTSFEVGSLNFQSLGGILNALYLNQVQRTKFKARLVVNTSQVASEVRQTDSGRAEPTP